MVYTPQIVSIEQIRDFFNPRLTEEEYPDQQLLAKIKAGEYLVSSKYGVSLTSTDTVVVEAVIMLIASRVGSEPRVMQRRQLMTRETWVNDKQEYGDPYQIVQGWEKDAINMLRNYLPDRRIWKIVEGS